MTWKKYIIAGAGSAIFGEGLLLRIGETIYIFESASVGIYQPIDWSLSVVGFLAMWIGGVLMLKAIKT
jgi:hypothetical protein